MEWERERERRREREKRDEEEKRERKTDLNKKHKKKQEEGRNASSSIELPSLSPLSLSARSSPHAPHERAALDLASPRGRATEEKKRPFLPNRPFAFSFFEIDDVDAD